jgi:hypothetical protein
MTGHRWAGPFRWTWYSICSKHREPREECPLCHCGQWEMDFAIALNQWVFAADPAFWQKEANRS